MAATSEIGIDEVRALLNGPLGRDAEAVEWVGAGEWSRCFGFEDRSGSWVIRLGKHREDFERDRRASAFRSPALPVPEVDAIGEAFDGWFAISSRVTGVAIEQLTPAQFLEALPSLFDALDALRGIELTQTSGWGNWGANGEAPFPSWRDYLLDVATDSPKKRTHGWRQRLVDSPVGDASFRAGLDRLADAADAAPCPRSVVHADLINDNVRVADARVSGLFDWGCSVYGDFLYDIAWLDFWSIWIPTLKAVDVRSQAQRHYAATGLDVPDFDERVRACQLHIALDHLAYTAHTARHDQMVAVERRMLPLLD